MEETKDGAVEKTKDADEGEKAPQVGTVKTLEDLMKLCEVSDKADLTKPDGYAFTCCETTRAPCLDVVLFTLARCPAT